jgi:hypothetical protein
MRCVSANVRSPLSIKPQGYRRRGARDEVDVTAEQFQIQPDSRVVSLGEDELFGADIKELPSGIEKGDQARKEEGAPHTARPPNLQLGRFALLNKPTRRLAFLALDKSIHERRPLQE